MQHAAINIEKEAIDLYKVIDNKRESYNQNSLDGMFFGFNQSFNHVSSVSDWEFFCNELEYE